MIPQMTAVAVTCSEDYLGLTQPQQTRLADKKGGGGGIPCRFALQSVLHCLVVHPFTFFFALTTTVYIVATSVRLSALDRQQS